MPTVDEEQEDLDRPLPHHADNFVPLLESNDPVTQRLLEKAERAAASDAFSQVCLLARAFLLEVAILSDWRGRRRFKRLAAVLSGKDTEAIAL